MWSGAMFVTIATLAPELFSSRANWKLLSSKTTASKFSSVKRADAVPRLPPAPALSPALLRMWPVRAVTVLFPLLPVTQIKFFAFTCGKTKSSSPVWVTPRRWASIKISDFGEIPELIKISSALSKTRAVFPPSSNFILWFLKISLTSSLIIFCSDTKTSAPRFFAKSASPWPLTPAPMTEIFLFL